MCVCVCVWGGGGGGTAVAMQVWVSPMFRETAESLWRDGGDLNFEKKMLENKKVHT